MSFARKYVAGISEILSSHSNPQRADDQKAYMRNQFEFFGLTAGDRRSLLRPSLRNDKLPDKSVLDAIIELLWEQPQREFQYFGQELLNKYSKSLTPGDLPMLEFMITHKSWWDTVDYIAANPVGTLMLSYPDLRSATCDKWFDSSNMWLRRTGLLFQLKYKKDMDRDLLTRQIDRLIGSDEFFIQKAIGWILREYSKTDTKWVYNYVSDRPKLSNLSRKEALRLIQQ